MIDKASQENVFNLITAATKPRASPQNKGKARKAVISWANEARGDFYSSLCESAKNISADRRQAIFDYFSSVSRDEKKSRPAPKDVKLVARSLLQSMGAGASSAHLQQDEEPGAMPQNVTDSASASSDPDPEEAMMTKLRAMLEEGFARIFARQDAMEKRLSEMERDFGARISSLERKFDVFVNHGGNMVAQPLRALADRGTITQDTEAEAETQGEDAYEEAEVGMEGEDEDDEEAGAGTREDTDEEAESRMDGEDEDDEEAGAETGEDTDERAEAGTKENTDGEAESRMEGEDEDDEEAGEETGEDTGEEAKAGTKENTDEEAEAGTEGEDDEDAQGEVKTKAEVEAVGTGACAGAGAFLDGPMAIAGARMPYCGVKRRRRKHEFERDLDYVRAKISAVQRMLGFNDGLNGVEEDSYFKEELIPGRLGRNEAEQQRYFPLA